MIPSEESNRILTGLIFLGVKAEALRIMKAAQENIPNAPNEADRLYDALSFLQRAAVEARYGVLDPVKRELAHNNVESLLANAFVDVFAAMHANNAQFGSAILRVLERRDAAISKNVTTKDL